MDVIKRWITDQLIEFLGFEEEVTIGLVINYLESVSGGGGREGVREGWLAEGGREGGKAGNL